MRRDNQRRILKIVSSYLPDLLLHRMSSGKSYHSLEVMSLSGGLLQADASGFTKMSEQLSQLGPKGAEELTEIFNRFFSSMLRIIFAAGGDVLKFGGDSLLVFFKGEQGAKRAAAVAVRMQKEMKRFERISTSGGTFSLALHAGINVGDFCALSLGDPTGKLELVILGQSINSTIRCNETAEAGETLLTRECYTQVKNSARVSERRDQFLKLEKLTKVGSLKLKPTSTQIRSKDAGALVNRLLPYLPQGIYEKMEADPTRTSLDSEHRQITVFFLNLVHSDKLLSDIAGSKKEACLALNEHFKAIQQAVADHGGVIARIDPYSVGEKVLVLFGAPVAREDDEERAILCALKVREKLNSLNADFPYPVRQRIGINTGYAFCGEVGSARRKEYTVMGKEVNLAARLMSQADSGEILVGHSTFQAVRSKFEASRIRLRVKGIARPVTAFRVQGIAKSQPASTERKPDRTGRMVIVGREREIRQINELLGKLTHHQGRLLSIVGEPGIGKSRLTEKLVDLCSQKGVRGTLVDCHYYGSNTPLLPWAEAVKAYLNITEPDPPQARRVKLIRALEGVDAVRWAPLFNDLLGLSVPQNEWTQSLDGKTKKERLFDTIVKFFLQRTAKAAGYLIFEDIHWIDQTSLELLLLLSKRMADHPLLLVLVHRPELKTDIFESLPHYHQIRLRELPKEDALNLASLHLEKSTLPDEMKRLLWEKSRGNPLYLQELIGSLRDSGQLAFDQTSGRYELSCRPDQIQIPDTVQDVIMARIDQLDETGRKIIKIASVIGRVFWFDTLASVVSPSLSPSKLKYWLGYLDRLDLVPLKETKPHLEYMFKHALTQEVAYGLLSFARRKDLHLKVGDHYERKFKNAREQVCELLAHHYEHSSNLSKAFVYLIQAGEKAKRTYANQEAVRFFDKAQKVYEQDSTETGRSRLPKRASSLMLKLREERGEVYRLIGEYGQAEKDFLAMLDLSRRRRNRADQTRALNLLAEIHWLRGDYEASQSYARQAHGISLKLDDDLGLAMSCNVFGDLYRRQGAFEKACQSYLSSLGYYKSLDHGEGIARAYNNVGICYWSLGSLSEAAGYLKRALEVRKLAQDKLGEAKTRNNLALIYQDRGLLTKSLEMLTSALVIFQRMGDKRNSGYCLGNLGTIYRSQARFSQALKAFRDSVKTFSEIGDQHALTYSIGNIGDVQLKMNNPEEAKTCYQATLSSARELGDQELESETLSRFGELCFLQGEREKSEQHFQEALALAREIKSDEFTMKAQAGLAELELAAGRFQDADKKSDTLLGMAGKENTREYLARGYLLRGRARSAMGLFGETESDLKEALKIAEEVGFREVAYKVHQELAELYTRLAETEGARRLTQAKAHSVQAREILEEIAAQIEDSGLRKRFLDSQLNRIHQVKRKSYCKRG